MRGKSLFTSRRLPQYVAAIIVSIAGLAFGMLQGWSSPSLPILRAKETAIGDEPVTGEEESWIISLVFLGALLASPIYSYVNQNLGRKAAGYLSTVPIIIGCLMIIFAESIMILCAARFIQGFFMSGTNIFATMYVGEIAEDDMRGALVNIRSLAVDMGIIIIYLVAPHLSIQMTGILSISIPLVFLFAYFWLPESPMFLLWKDKSEEARNAYLWFRGGDIKAADQEMVKLRAVIKENESEKKHLTIRELISARGTRKALLIAFVLAIVQQFSGMNVVFTYSATIFEMTGSTMTPELESIIFSLVNFSGSVFSFFGSDLAGRRPILIFTQIFQGFCLVALGTYLYARKLGVDVEVVGIIPVITISLYCFCVVAGPANLFYVVISETFRPEARGLAMNVVSSAQWTLAFLSTKFYSTMVDKMGDHGCFLLFATVSFAGAIFVYFQLPETKNRSLESILEELNGDLPEDKVQPTLRKTMGSLA